MFSRQGKLSLSPVSLYVFSLVPDLLFDCSPVLEYAKILLFLQSFKGVSAWFLSKNGHFPLLFFSTKFDIAWDVLLDDVLQWKEGFPDYKNYIFYFVLKVMMTLIK